MDLRYLNYIIAIADEGTISGAAKKLYLSQPNLSMYLSRLEQELGMELFWRVDGRYIPTPSGEKYLDTAKQILELSSAADLALCKNKNLYAGTVRIGMASDAQKNIIPLVLPVWRQILPNFKYHLFEVGAHTAQDMLLKKQLDLGIFQGGDSFAELCRYPLTREDFLIAVPKSFGLSAYAAPAEGCFYPFLPAVHLQNIPMILQSQGRLREKALHYFYNYRIRPNTVVETGSITSSIRMANRGVGCAFLTNIIAVLDSADLVNADIFTIEKCTIREVWIMECVYPQNSYLAPVLERMAQVCHDSLSAVLPVEMMIPFSPPSHR